MNFRKGKVMESVEIGMGVTEICWSDRRAWTVIGIVSKREIKVRRDRVKRIDNRGTSEDQEYEYSYDDEGEVETITYRKNGKWVRKGEKNTGNGFVLGYRREYYDYSF